MAGFALHGMQTFNPAGCLYRRHESVSLSKGGRAAGQCGRAVIGRQGARGQVQSLCQGGRVIYKPPTEQTTAIIENKPVILKITPRIHFSAIVHLPIFLWVRL
jgi:hypothetical protein